MSLCLVLQQLYQRRCAIASLALPAYRFHLALIYVTMDWVINHMLRNADKRGY